MTTKKLCHPPTDRDRAAAHLRLSLRHLDDALLLVGVDELLADIEVPLAGGLSQITDVLAMARTVISLSSRELSDVVSQAAHGE